MLLIGSYAAQLRGILPAWRNGHVGDADFVCSRAAAGAMMELFGAAVVEHVPDRCFLIDRAGGLNIDIDLRGHLVEGVADHADAMTVPVNGASIACMVARPELILALREASRDVVPKAAAKADLDIEAYRSAGISPDPALMRLALQFRKPD